MTCQSRNTWQLFSAFFYKCFNPVKRVEPFLTISVNCNRCIMQNPAFINFSQTWFLLQFVSFYLLVLNARYRKGVLRWLRGRIHLYPVGEAASILVGKTPLEEMASLFHSLFLPGKLHGQGGLAGYSLGITKSNITKFRK